MHDLDELIKQLALQSELNKKQEKLLRKFNKERINDRRLILSCLALTILAIVMGTYKNNSTINPELKGALEQTAIILLTGLGSTAVINAVPKHESDEEKTDETD